MKEGSRCFVDTNVLLAASDADREAHSACLDLVKSAMSGGVSLFVSGQVIREYLVVATRPISENGLGMTVKDALSNVAEFRKCIQVLDENTQVAQRLLQLIRKHEWKGKRIHDANIVATMLEHGLARLVTLNGKHFERIEGVSVVEPESGA